MYLTDVRIQSLFYYPTVCIAETSEWPGAKNLFAYTYEIMALLTHCNSFLVYAILTLFSMKEQSSPTLTQSSHVHSCHISDSFFQFNAWNLEMQIPTIHLTFSVDVAAAQKYIFCLVSLPACLVHRLQINNIFPFLFPLNHWHFYYRTNPFLHFPLLCLSRSHLS